MAITSEKKTETAARAPQEVPLDHALKLAQAHHRNGNLEIAERTYRDILRAEPDHYPTVQLLAAVCFQRGNMGDALKYGKISTEVSPDNAAAWSNYAAMLSTEENYAAALDAYDQALAIDPEMVDAYVNKAHTLWLMKRYEEAEEAAAQATLLDPDKTAAYMNLGIALASQGKIREAEEVWQQVIELDPASGRAYSNWCNALRVAGNLDEARQKGLKAVELSPDDHEAHNNLGCVHRELGEFDAALACFNRATDIKPEFAIAHLNKAKTLLAGDRPAEVLVAARYTLSFDKNSDDAYIQMALAHKAMGDLAKARQMADMAISLAPKESYHLLALADILAAGDQFDEAEAVLQKALALGPNEPNALVKLAEVRRALDMLDEAVEAIDLAMANFQETPPLLIQKARILMHASRIDEALVVTEKALQMAPHNTWALLTKSELLLTVNRKDEARAALEAARPYLEGMPGFYYSLADFKDFTADDPDFLRLKAIEKNLKSLGNEGQAVVHYALAEAYEDIGDADQAFVHLKAAAEAKNVAAKFNPDAVRAVSEGFKAIFNTDSLRQYKGRGCDSDVPVFIVGMPRSGTTLTEQIISSHPDVYGAGELHDLGAVVRTLGPLTADNASVMGQAYVDRICARDKSGKAGRVTDKMPGNYTNMGLIHAILPNAKIIHCRRSPMDNLLSCYRQNFATGHSWSYSFEGLAAQYAIYRDTVDYWRSVLPPGTFIDVDYEETVGNFETQARRLIDYVGLPWNDACLEPHKQKRAVLTASKDQVIRPVYQSSVEAWRRYEKQMMPLYEMLKDKGYVS